MRKILLFVEICIILSVAELLNINISHNCTDINDIFKVFLFDRYCLISEILLSILWIDIFYYFNNVLNRNIYLITIFSLKTNNYWLTKLFMSWYISFFYSSFILIKIKDMPKVKTLDVLYSILLGIWLTLELFKPKDKNKRRRKLREIIDDITIENLMKQLIPSNIPS